MVGVGSPESLLHLSTQSRPCQAGRLLTSECLVRHTYLSQSILSTCCGKERTDIPPTPHSHTLHVETLGELLLARVCVSLPSFNNSNKSFWQSQDQEQKRGGGFLHILEMLCSTIYRNLILSLI